MTDIYEMEEDLVSSFSKKTEKRTLSVKFVHLWCHIDPDKRWHTWKNRYGSSVAGKIVN